MTNEAQREAYRQMVAHSTDRSRYVVQPPTPTPPISDFPVR